MHHSGGGPSDRLGNISGDRTEHGSISVRRAPSFLGLSFRAVSADRSAARSKRAVMAVAHALLVIAYHMLRRGQNYCELGANHFDLIDVNHIRLPLARRLAEPRGVSSEGVM